MKRKPPTSIELARRRPLHRDTVTSVREIADEAEAGKVSALIVIAARPGYSCWIVRSRMTSRDRINLVGQLEYLKYLLLQDDDSETS